MKEQYIKQVEKELSLTRKAKKEVVRDLNEVFASALEHGETEQQVIGENTNENATSRIVSTTGIQYAGKALKIFVRET